MEQSSSKKIKLLIILPLLLWGAALQGREGNFSSYLQIFDYPEIKEKISPLEFREMERTVVTDQGVSYPDKLIKLYLLSSDITDEQTFNRYLEDFKSKLNKARKIIREKGYDRKLNRYNLAEFLLHFLHNEYFFTEQRGSAASYNIGIRETLDSGKFNCFKSALIYNAFLEYFGYRTSFVLVPNHIYSLIDVNGTTINVETTNRYGFDSFNSGKGKYRRVFDIKNISAGVKYYRKKTPMDNISVVIMIYVYRSHLYSGEKKYSDIHIEKNYPRAAALSILALYLNYSDKSNIADNTLYKVYFVSKNNIDKNPEMIDVEYRRYSKILDHKLFERFSAKHRYNIEVLAGNAVAGIRKKILNNTDMNNMQEVLKLFINESISAKKYIKRNRDIRNSTWNNSIVEFNSLLLKKYSPRDLESIKKYSRLLMNMLNHPVFKSGNFIGKYLEQYRGNICIFIDNLGIAELNSRNWRETDGIYREGLEFLQKELKINSGYYYRLIIEHHNNAKKNL
jgi:hypothetical protein